MSSELRFTVLGPVRAWRGDEELDLGAPQQRALLAILLLAEGRQITVEGLISGLWEEDLPHAAVGTVRTYVSRLRRTLEESGTPGTAGASGAPGAVGASGALGAPGLIRTAGAGYVIPARTGELDLDVFQRLTKEARAARAAGGAGVTQAVARLREALALPQGAPLAGIPGPYAEAQRVRISELLITATEERIALELELGAHASMVAELQTLLTDHPMRERLSELLMLALYRSGRQADALAVFDSTRRRLAEDLGIDPGPAMRDMHQRILENDGSLAAPARPPHGLEVFLDEQPLIPFERPAQLPADLTSFAGRRGELVRLHSLLEGSQPVAGLVVAAIDGMAGVGKTALAVHWAHQVADQFPDGQLYANLRGFDSDKDAAGPGEVLRGFLDALGMPPQRVPADVDAQASMYRSLMSGRRMLVLLDNARDMEQVRPLLPGSPGCVVIVTSRNRLAGLITAYDARTVSLDAFCAEEARQALALRLGAERTTAEPEAVEEIIDRCAGLPLAMAVVAARATLYPDLPLAEIATELRDARRRLDTLSIDGATADVRAVLSWSYRLLSEPARRLFRLLSVHGGPDFSFNAVASLAGLPKAEAQRLLTELTSARLLTDSRPGRFTMHDLTQVYAAELSATDDSPDDRRMALERLLDHLLHSSHAAQLLLRPSFPVPEPGAARPGVTLEELSGYEQAMAWFGTERQVLETAVRSAPGHGFPAHAWRLALTLQQFYRRQGYFFDWTATMRHALRTTLDAADHTGQGHVRLSLADVNHLIGRDAEAIAELDRARQLTSQADRPASRAYQHSLFGAIYAGQGAHDEAVGHYRQAYTLYLEVSHQAGQAHALAAIGGCYGHQGRYSEATGLIHDAIVAYRELGDPNGESDCWVRLGDSHHLLGEDEQAMTCYRRAVVLVSGLGSRTDEAGALISLGDSAQAAGDYRQAKEAWESAMTILKQLGLPCAISVRRKLRLLRELAEPAA
jgi:DNA-binding SARP family transcriptional activator/tetratricopeptide (TPR) repeat protein